MHTPSLVKTTLRLASFQFGHQTGFNLIGSIPAVSPALRPGRTFDEIDATSRTIGGNAGPDQLRWADDTPMWPHKVQLALVIGPENGYRFVQ